MYARINIMNMLAFGVPGPSEWVLILVIVLVLFGAKKLPELARSLGQSMNEFRKAREDFDKELHAAGNEVKGAVQQPIPTGSEPAAI
jgi:sec-independent protein translocase protein TatA